MLQSARAREARRPAKLRPLGVQQRRAWPLPVAVIEVDEQQERCPGGSLVPVRKGIPWVTLPSSSCGSRVTGPRPIRRSYCGQPFTWRCNSPSRPLAVSTAIPGRAVRGFSLLAAVSAQAEREPPNPTVPPATRAVRVTANPLAQIPLRNRRLGGAPTAGKVDPCLALPEELHAATLPLRPAGRQDPLRDNRRRPRHPPRRSPESSRSRFLCGLGGRLRLQGHRVHLAFGDQRGYPPGRGCV